MKTRRILISRDDSAIAWAKRMDAICFVRFLVDRIPNPVLGECIKTIRQDGVDVERKFLRALLEHYQGYPETVDRPDISLVRDIWLREFREGTCESLHPSFGRPEIGGSSPWSLWRMVVWAICSCYCATQSNFRERVVSSTRSWKPPRSGRWRTGEFSCSNISCIRTGVSQEKIRWRRMWVNVNSIVACPCWQIWLLWCGSIRWL